MTMAPSCTDVSYTWGDSADTADISLNRRPFPVRKNLLALLLELQRQKYRGSSG